MITNPVQEEFRRNNPPQAIDQRAIWASVIVLLVLMLEGCAGPTRLATVPPAHTYEAQPLGIPNARFFPMLQTDELVKEGAAAAQRERQTLGLLPTAPLPTANLLSISGGGDDGAFGTGILVGWTEAGNRPQFQLVTGVSTGALIAPFAFLGPQYDPQLRKLYTTIDASDIYENRGFMGVLFDDAVSDTTPLWNLISRYVDDALMAQIAQEYRKGRLLFIGTTDLDAEQPCLWNIGAIAASGQPGALDLIRKILRASSAVPAFFQPVLIDVQANGQTYQELHVDGGAIAQMFLYPPNIKLGKMRYRDRKAFLIRNAKESPEWKEVEPRTLSIAGRAMSTMIKYSGKNDLFRIYTTTKRDNVDFNLAYIENDFTAEDAGEFDRTYMNALFDYGYEKARHGYAWKKIPPFLTPDVDDAQGIPERRAAK